LSIMLFSITISIFYRPSFQLRILISSIYYEIGISVEKERVSLKTFSVSIRASRDLLKLRCCR
jgi:hypothetical protein